jgi:YD repeat-containing protein
MTFNFKSKSILIVGSLAAVSFLSKSLVFRGHDFRAVEVHALQSAEAAPAQNSRILRKPATVIERQVPAEAKDFVLNEKNPEAPAGEDSAEETGGDEADKDEIIYWDQLPEQKVAIDYFMQLTAKNLIPEQEPTAVMKNQQDFDQVVYDTDDSRLTQWKKGSETLVEVLEMQNGDKVTRRFPNSTDPDGVAETAYEYKDGSAGGVTYYRSGNLRSSWSRSGGKTIWYYYDEQGRLINTAEQ